jgi:hypothetical protein
VNALPSAARFRSLDRALATLLDGETEVRTAVLAERLRDLRPAPTPQKIGRILLDRGWSRVVRGGRHVWAAPPASDNTGVAATEPSDLRRQGLLLEAAASTLNGLHARADASAFADAVEQHGLERDAFRALLHARTGISAEQLEHWLAL